jgi:hypothetical protein
MAKKILRFKIERDETGHLPSEVALDIPMGRASCGRGRATACPSGPSRTTPRPRCR